MLTKAIFSFCVLLLVVGFSASLSFENKNVSDDALQSFIQSMLWKKATNASSFSLKNELLAVPVKKVVTGLLEVGLSDLDKVHEQIYSVENFKSVRRFLGKCREYLDKVETFTHAMEDPENLETIFKVKPFQPDPELKHLLLGLKNKDLSQFNLALTKTNSK